MMHAQVEAEVQFGAQTELRLRVHSAKPGLLWLEAQRGAVLSSPCPVILLPVGHDKLAAEVVRLVSRPAELARHAGQAPEPAELATRRYCEGCSWSDERCNDFLADLGLVLSKGTHSSSAAADLAHAWQCCVDGRQERSSGCSHSSSAPVSKAFLLQASSYLKSKLHKGYSSLQCCFTLQLAPACHSTLRILNGCCLDLGVQCCRAQLRWW